MHGMLIDAWYFHFDFMYQMHVIVTLILYDSFYLETGFCSREETKALKARTKNVVDVLLSVYDSVWIWL